MRWLINYIRSCFCNHDWEILSHRDVVDDFDDVIGEKWVYRCKKCGYCKKYRSY